MVFVWVIYNNMTTKKTTLYLFFVLVTVIISAVSQVFVAVAATGYQGQVLVRTHYLSDIQTNSVKIACVIDPRGNTNTQGWVEWGRDTAVVNRTENIYQGTAIDSYVATISNLAQGTKYYYRCAAQGNQQTVYGDMLDFTTKGVLASSPTIVVPSSTGSTGSGAVQNANTSLFVITKPVTDITGTSAKLNAVALPVGTVQTFGWFEWGATPALGRTTTRRSLGTSPSIPWSESISGLTPGTTYFLKPVIENQNGLFEGALFSFRTTGVSPVVPAPVSTNTGTSVVKKTTVPKSEPNPTAVSAPKEQKTIEVSVVSDGDTAAPGGRIKETIQFENTTGATMKEVVVHAVIPCGAAYVANGSDTFLQTGTMLTRKVGDVKPKETVKLILWLETPDNAADKTSLETIAVVNWEDKTNPNYTQSVGRVAVVVDKDKAVKENAAAAGVTKSVFSFFPTNLKDWGAVIGVLFILFAMYVIFLVTRRKGDIFENEKVLEVVPAVGNTQYIIPGLHPTGVPHRRYSSNDPFVTDTNIQKNKTILPVVPVKKTFTEKGAPPDNLPV